MPSTVQNRHTTRMWANAQRDGHPAKYRWRPLFNAANFGWRPLLECCAVMLQRRENCCNLQGCPKLANRSQPLVGRSSPYYEDMWRRYRCLTSFFPIVDRCLSLFPVSVTSSTALPAPLSPVIDNAVYSAEVWYTSNLRCRRRLDVYHTSTHGVALVRI